jgi:hypothetical protein
MQSTLCREVQYVVSYTADRHYIYDLHLWNATWLLKNHFSKFPNL